MQKLEILPPSSLARKLKKAALEQELHTQRKVRTKVRPESRKAGRQNKNKMHLEIQNDEKHHIVLHPHQHCHADQMKKIALGHHGQAQPTSRVRGH